VILFKIKFSQQNNINQNKPNAFGNKIGVYTYGQTFAAWSKEGIFSSTQLLNSPA